MKKAFVPLLAATFISFTAVVDASPSLEPSNHLPVRSLRAAALREGARLAAESEPRPAPAKVGAHDRNWLARHPVIVGTLAGAGVGLGFAATSGCESSSDYTCGGIAMFFAGTGAGLGAIGGLVASLFMR